MTTSSNRIHKHCPLVEAVLDRLVAQERRIQELERERIETARLVGQVIMNQQEGSSNDF
ncbi:hypothetical protein [Jiella mangrovi]|uniref:Uncharacterized protein n=1 Tax=Jiella mangrovi TaxID=2821407 RepID=A0ABS4BBX0_9HYPH|nr:hypothetical protein [Jiella mangrovi]MBP0614234.1 hypothetical protein [Jiella mangrovi]